MNEIPDSLKLFYQKLVDKELNIVDLVDALQVLGDSQDLDGKAYNNVWNLVNYLRSLPEYQKA